MLYQSADDLYLLAIAWQANQARADGLLGANIASESVCLQGASAFLQSLAHKFGSSLFTSLPVVQKLMLQPLLVAHPPGPSPTAPAPLDAKQATETMQILKILGPVVDQSLLPEVLQAIPAVVQCCGHSQAAVQDMAVRCAVELGAAHGHLMLPPLLRCVQKLMDACTGMHGALQRCLHNSLSSLFINGHICRGIHLQCPALQKPF